MLFSWLWFQEIVAAEHLVYSFCRMKYVRRAVDMLIVVLSTPKVGAMSFVMVMMGFLIKPCLNQKRCAKFSDSS